MFFEYPLLLWLMVLPALLVAYYVYMELSERRPHLRVSTSAPWLVKKTPFVSALRHIPYVFKVASLVFIIIALARPRSFESLQKVNTEGIDIVLAMDVSTSMLARDFEPDRLNAAKQLGIEFVSQRPSDRIGIVVFAGESYTQCPLTTDRPTLVNMIAEIQTGLIDDGTAIGNGLATAVARLKDSDSKSKVVILLTDGVNNSGDVLPEKAIEVAKTFGIKVYTIGVGKNGVAPYPYAMTPQGMVYQQAEVEIDEELLKKIAQETGGRYFRATDNTKLKEIYGEINQMETVKLTVDNMSVYEELFGKYLLWALLAIGLSMMFNWILMRRLP